MPEFRLLPAPKLIGSATSDPALGRSATSACTDREARTAATVMCWLELATESAEELAQLCRLPLSQYHRASASSIAGSVTYILRQSEEPFAGAAGRASLPSWSRPKWPRLMVALMVWGKLRSCAEAVHRWPTLEPAVRREMPAGRVP